MSSETGPATRRKIVPGNVSPAGEAKATAA
jgi:hypothetical protein